MYSAELRDVAVLAASEVRNLCMPAPLDGGTLYVLSGRQNPVNTARSFTLNNPAHSEDCVQQISQRDHLQAASYSRQLLTVNWRRRHAGCEQSEGDRGEDGKGGPHDVGWYGAMKSPSEDRRIVSLLAYMPHTESSSRPARDYTNGAVLPSICFTASEQYDKSATSAHPANRGQSFILVRTRF